MYKTFLHVSCITILEICFFFYYIGPLETDIFYSYIRRIIDGPLDKLDETLVKWNIDRKQFVEGIYSEDNNNDTRTKLKNESIIGKKEREKDNIELFYTTLEFWSIIPAVTIFLFLCEFYYCYCIRKRKSKTVLPIENNDLSDDDTIENEMILSPYRKNSLDEEELELQLKYERKNKYIYLCLKTCSHYLLFGISIITFQYIFFRYIVFEYKPLSIEEIKYYLYNYLLTN